MTFRLGSKQDEIKKKEISIFLEKYRVLFIRALNVGINIIILNFIHRSE
jgi:hypothetical protein